MMMLTRLGLFRIPNSCISNSSSRILIRSSSNMNSMIDQILSDISKTAPKLDNKTKLMGDNNNNNNSIQSPFKKQDGSLLKKSYSDNSNLGNSFERSGSRSDWNNNNNKNRYSNNRNGFNKNDSNNNNNNNNKNNRQMRNQRNRKVDLQFTSGSDRLQQLFLMTYKKIRSINPRGRIIEIQPSGLGKTNIMTIFENINLDEEGIDIVRIDEVNGEETPLVKRIDLKKAGQLYSDYLHEQATLNSGLISKRSKPENHHSKEGKTKMYKLSWTLSLNDLVNVKLKEIWNQVLKNNRVEIYLASKRDLRSAGDNFLKSSEDDVNHFRNDKLDEVERIKREKLRDTILNFIESQREEHKIMMTIEGDIGNRMLIVLKLDKLKK